MSVDPPVLTVVGAGTLLPDPARGSASFHLAWPGRGGSGHRLLLDVGAGTLHGMARADVAWREIDTVALTHFHPDHLSDLPALLAAYRYEGLDRPLTVVGPPGVRSLMERMADLHGAWILAPSRPLTIVELGDGDAWASLDGVVRLEVRSTPHTDESVAYRVSGAGADGEVVVGYTGDTGPSASLAAFLAGCDVLVAECALADPPELDSHLAPSTLAELASHAAPDLLVVSHVYPPQTPESAAAAVRDAYRGRVVAARDGMRIRVAGDGTGVDPPADGL